MRIVVYFYLFISVLYADSYKQELEESLKHNEKIKQLEYQIKALEAKSKAQAKWDNPNINLSYSNAEVMQPFNINANDMQNIGIGISQKFDINGKKALDSNITKLEAQIKIFELKNLKNQYALSLIQSLVEANKNKSSLKLMQDSINNVNTLISSLRGSNNFNLLQIQKLNLLKARLEIKKNELENKLENSHITASEISFENFSHDSFKDSKLGYDINILQDKQFLDDIMKNNYEIAIANLQQTIGLKTLNVAQKNAIPDLEVSFSYMLRIDKNDMFSVGMSMPIPTWGKELAQIKEAKYNKLLQESQALEVQNKIKHSAKTLISKIKTLQDNLAVIDSILLPANKKIIELYKHHSVSQSNAFSELYAALNEQIDTEILRLQTISDIAITYYTLRSLRGEI